MKIFLQRFKAFVLNPDIIILIVLIIAGFLRIYRIKDYMTFLGDEGRDALVVYNILHGNFTLLGPAASVGGFFLGPVYYYFMSPFLFLFNYSPVGPSVMVALFGIATVYLLYKFASEFFYKRVGLIAAFLYSISPIVIAYSRSSWNPNVMPFFSLAAIYVLYRGIKTKNWKFLLTCGLLLGISMQLHYLAFFLGGIVAAYILIINFTQGLFADSKNWALNLTKQYFLIFTGFILGFSPFLAFEARHGFQNTLSIFRFVFKSGDTGAGLNFVKNITDVFFRLFARLVVNYPPQEQIASGQHQNIEIWFAFSLILSILSLGVLLYSFFKNFPNKNNFDAKFPDFSKLSLLIVWLVLGIGFFGFYKKPIYDYYFGFMFTLPFILVAYSLDFLTLGNKILKIAVIIVFFVLTLINLYAIPFRHTPNRQLKQVRTISEFVLEKTGGEPFNFALITGGNSDHAYRYFFKLENQDPVTIEPPMIDPERRTITDQLLVVCEGPCQPLGNSLWEVAGFGRAEIAGEWDVIVVKVYKLVHYEEK